MQIRLAMFLSFKLPCQKQQSDIQLLDIKRFGQFGKYNSTFQLLFKVWLDVSYEENVRHSRQCWKNITVSNLQVQTLRNWETRVDDFLILMDLNFCLS